MELSFKDLKKREVINVSDGRSLGSIINILLDFPEGVLSGIMVPGKRSKGLFGFLNRTEEFIGVSKILKIGNDVILVDLKCGDVCSPSTAIRPPKPPRPQGPLNHRQPKPECPTCEQLFGEDLNSTGTRFNTDDY